MTWWVWLILVLCGMNFVLCGILVWKFWRGQWQDPAAIERVKREEQAKIAEIEKTYAAREKQEQDLYNRLYEQNKQWASNAVDRMKEEIEHEKQNLVDDDRALHSKLNSLLQPYNARDPKDNDSKG